MSYNPVPPRVWSRVQNQCTYTDASGNFDINYNQVYIPLTKQTVTQAQANYEDKMIYKGNVLQYKGNSSRLTKSQKYTQLAKGFGPNRTKVFATQSQTYTNPNITGLRRINYQTYPYSNQIVGAPNNPSGPFQYNVQNPNDCSNNSIQDGGTLVCGTFANPCTGEIIKQGATSSIIYNPASASDVPGSSVLFWDTQVQTWFPKPRYFMNNSTDKWPVNYKGLDGKSGLVSAVRPDAPVLTFITPTSSSITLSWTDVSSNCISVSSYNIYQNGRLIANVPYPTNSYTYTNCGANTFYITSVSTNIESNPSNTITSNNGPLPPVLTLGIVTNTTTTFSWTESSLCATSYKIYLNGIYNTSVNSTTNSYTLTTLSCTNTIYITSVSDQNIESNPSNTITSNNGPLPPVLTLGIVTNTTTTFSWTESSLCATSYKIYLNGIYNTSVNSTTNSYTLTTLSCTNTIYITSVSDQNIESNPSNTITSNNGPNALGSGLNEECLTIAFDSSGNLYAGGVFNTAGGNSANYIAKWNGTMWSALDSGLNDECLTIAFDSSGNLYAGGLFYTAGGNSANYIAKWDGSSWSAVGSGFGWFVRCLTYGSDGNLYAGGPFTTTGPGGISANCIAKWDGSSWSALGSGLSINPGLSPECYTIAFDSTGNLYAGGEFTTAGSISANNIAKWNGTTSTWSALGSGLATRCNTIAFDSSGNLYAGGLFTTAGGNSANYIAKWDGSSWSALGSGLNEECKTIAFDSTGNLYAGGLFTTAGGNSANYIAKWDGSSWTNIPCFTLDNYCNTIAFNSSGNLYAGGDFTTAGSVAVNYIVYRTT